MNEFYPPADVPTPLCIDSQPSETFTVVGTMLVVMLSSYDKLDYIG